MNVSNRGTFGFIRIKDVDGLLGAAQNAEEKRLSPLRGVSELMDGSGRLREACARHGRILRAGEGCFAAHLFSVKMLTASVRQPLVTDFSFLTCEMPAKLDRLYPHRRREAFAGYGLRRGDAARGSGVSSVWLCGF